MNKIYKSCFISNFKYFASDEKVLAFNGSSFNFLVYRGADLLFVFIHMSAVKVAISSVDGCLHSGADFTWLGL
jgi:hypothetical protein